MTPATTEVKNIRVMGELRYTKTAREFADKLEGHTFAVVSERLDREGYTFSRYGTAHGKRTVEYVKRDRNNEGQVWLTLHLKESEDSACTSDQ